MNSSAAKSPASETNPSRPVPRHRINVRIAGDLGAELTALARKRGCSQADIVEAALLSLMSPDATDRRDAAITRRLDRQSTQLESLLHDISAATETLALFIRYFMSVTPALPEARQAEARAKGAERFSAFVDTLARRLAEGKPLLGDLHARIHPAVSDFRSRDEIDAAFPESGHG